MTTPVELVDVDDIDIELAGIEHEEKYGEKPELEAAGDDNGKTRDGKQTSNAPRREFPNPFYDPATAELMKEPVVDANGDSHEKSRENNTKTYPNRALQEIIQYELGVSENSVQGSLRRLNEALQKGWGRLVEQSAFGTKEFRPLPDAFYCPILGELMADPMITKEGVTYEGEAIEHWIRANGTSPMTRNTLNANDLRPNNALYELIQFEKRRTPESIHPSIRRWKETTDAVTSRRKRRQSEVEESGPNYNQGEIENTTNHNHSNLPTTVGEILAETGDVDAQRAHMENGIRRSLPSNIHRSLPSTQREMEERQRRNRPVSNKCLAAVLCFTLVVLAVFFPYTVALVLLYTIITCIQCAIPIFIFWITCGGICQAIREKWEGRHH